MPLPSPKNPKGFIMVALLAAVAVWIFVPLVSRFIPMPAASAPAAK